MTDSLQMSLPAAAWLYGIFVVSISLLCLILTWLFIFTAVRAAIRSARRDEHDVARREKYGLPPQR